MQEAIRIQVIIISHRPMRQQRASAANETSAMKIRKYITIKQEFDEIRPYKKSKELCNTDIAGSTRKKNKNNMKPKMCT